MLNLMKIITFYQACGKM